MTILAQLAARRKLFYLALFAFWSAVAAASLAIGVSQALHPQSSEDLLTIRRWGKLLLDGASPYLQPNSDADYPPHAILLMSPFALFHRAGLVEVWTFCKLAMLPLVAFLAVKAVKPSATWYAAALPIAMFLSWSSVRIGLWTGQVTMPLLAFGLAAVILSKRHQSIAGFLLGLSLMKPHIGAPFLIWAMLTRRLRMVVGATAVVLGGLIAFALIVHSNPVDVTVSYWDVLVNLYGGLGRPAEQGELDFRPIARAFIDPPWLADTAHVALMLVLLAWISWTAFSAKAQLGDAFDIVLVGLLSVWSLAAFYNQPYNRVLLLPGVMWLLLGRHPKLLWREWLIAAGLQIMLVPSFTWRDADQFTLRIFMTIFSDGDEPRLLGMMLNHVGRLVVLFVLAYIAVKVAGLRHEAKKPDALVWPQGRV